MRSSSRGQVQHENLLATMPYMIRVWMVSFVLRVISVSTYEGPHPSRGTYRLIWVRARLRMITSVAVIVTSVRTTKARVAAKRF